MLNAPHTSITAPRSTTLHDHEWATLFDLAPVSLWLEDFSALKDLFSEWRANGVTDLRRFLQAHPEKVAECTERLRVLQVNQRTLDLYGAKDEAQLIAQLSRVFRGDMFSQYVDELSALWDGAHQFINNSVNYTLDGRRIEISLRGQLLPGHETDWTRVLVSIEDHTASAQAQRALEHSERYARGLFEHSPVSLWVADFGDIKRRLDDMRQQGVVDLRSHIETHPKFVEHCIAQIRVIDVNQQTIDLFKAPDKATLLANLVHCFRDDMVPHFAEQLIDLYNGKLVQHREVVNYTLAGDKLHVVMQLAVLPGHESTCDLVQLSLTDITARKAAEAHLEYLSQHDPLTQLHNRAHFSEEVLRLEQKGPWPVTVIVVDVNGLKAVNDRDGHAAGDALLRRMGDVLQQAIRPPMTACRIGGDEFVLLLPGTPTIEAERLLEELQSSVEHNNRSHESPALSVSIGMATSEQGERVELAMAHADQAMYQAKKAYYSRGKNRRRT